MFMVALSWTAQLVVLTCHARTGERGSAVKGSIMY
jgi:hypothetical protein